MKLSVVVFVHIINHFSGFSRAENSPTKFLDTGHCLSDKRHEVDNIIEELKHEQWSMSEESCYRATLSFLYGVKNRTLWATWVWDSNTRPTGTFYGSSHHPGGYDQCLKAPWTYKHHNLRTQYCLADVVLSEYGGKREKDLDPFGTMEGYFDTSTEKNRRMNKIFYGICIPANCENSSVLKILRIFFANSHLGSLNAKFGIEYCQVSNEQYKYPIEFFAFTILFMSLIVITVFSTWFVRNKESNTLCSSISKAFCMKRNLKNLFKVPDDDIRTLNILKTAISFSSVYLHHLHFGLALATMNSLDADKYSLFFNLNVGVDCFYAVSGMLLMKSLMEKPKNPLKQVLIRYLRLVTPFAFMILYTICVSCHIGSGPFWTKYAKFEQDNCKKNWLWSILMLNNYVNNKEICQITWWYIPSDFHFFAIATLVIYLYKKNKIGNKLLASIVVVLIAIPGLETYWNGYKPIPVYDVESLLNVRNNALFREIYMKSHNRMGPPIVGMLAGYILSKYKPAKYNNLISVKWTKIGIMASFVTLIIIVASGEMMMQREYNAVVAALYASMYRVAWVFITCVIVLLAEYGDLPLVTFLHQYRFFLMVNRLSYCIYLTHTAFIQRRWYSSRNPYSFDPLSIFMDSTGVLISTLIGGLVLWLIVEAPMAHLINIIVNPRSNATKSHHQELSKENNIKLLKNNS